MYGIIIIEKMYGTIKDSKLTISNIQTTKAKPITYAKIPVFDQTTQAVFQTAYEDKLGEIHFGVEVRAVVQDKVDWDKIEIDRIIEEKIIADEIIKEATK